MAANERQHLMRPVALGAFVLVLCGALFLLVPSSRELEGLSTTGAPSELSLKHLEALVSANPKDQRLRLLLAGQEYATGEVDRAEANVAPYLDETGEVGRGARRLAMKIRATRFRAAAPEARDVELARLERTLRAALADPQDNETLEEAARLALEIGRPRLAAEIYERLSKEDTARYVGWLTEAAKWHRAGGDERRASELYDAAAERTGDPAKRLDLAILALDSAAGSGDPGRALALAEKYLGDFPNDPSLLERALRFASATGRSSRARDLGRALAETVNRNDPDAIAKQIDRELAAGDLGAAMMWLRRLADLRPNDPLVHARMAQLGEWAGDQKLALAEYMWLIEHDKKFGFIDHAIAMARAIHDLPATLELLRRRAEGTRATDRHVLELVQAYEDLGEPEMAVKVLRDHLARRGGARAMWARLAVLEENVGEPERAADTWRRVAETYGLTVSEAKRAAALLWRVDRPRDALDALASVRESEPGHDLDFWLLFSDLAWEMNDDDLALRALRELRKRGDRSLVVVQRLMAIEYRRGHLREAADYAIEGWKLTGDTAMLFEAVDMLGQLGKDEESLELLTEAATRKPELTKLEEYWDKRGTALQHLGRMREACRAFDEALHVEPGSPNAFSTALGCALAIDDRQALTRDVALWRHRIDKAPDVYGPYALALLRLGRDREAIVYLTRQVRLAPHDYTVILELADAVERTGDAARAYRLRRHALVKLWPRAIAALKAPPGDSSAKRELVARAILARRFEGIPASYRWLEHLLPKGQGRVDDAEVADLAVSYYLADGNSESARRILVTSRAPRPTSDHSAKLTLALLDNDVAEVERLLAKPDGVTPRARVEALLRTGHDAEALMAVDAAIDAAERDAAADLRSQRADIADRVAPTGKVAYAYDAYGPLVVHGPRLEALLYRDKARLEAGFKRNELSSTDESLPLGHDVEYAAHLALRLRTLRSQTRLAIGANARRGVTLPQATLAHETQLVDRVTLKGELELQEAPTDTVVLRAIGVRDSASLEGAVAITARDRVELAGNVFRERTISQDELAVGGNGTLTASHVILHASPEWAAFASGAILGRKVARGAQQSLRAALPYPADLAPDQLLPTAGYSATVGTRVQRGDPTTPWGAASFPRYVVSVSGGRLWPQGQWIFEARAGAGTRLFGGDVLGASAYYARGLAGAGGDAFRGVFVHYTRSL